MMVLHEYPLSSASYRVRIAPSVEAILAGAARTQFPIGDAPGMAELCIVPQVYNARRYKVDLAAFPHLVAVADRALLHPAFQRAAP